MTNITWICTRYHQNVWKPYLERNRKKREINDSNGSQLIHQCIVVDLSFQRFSFSILSAKMLLQDEASNKMSTFFFSPSNSSSLQGSHSTVNSTICLATYYHGFTSMCKNTFSPLVCQSNMFHWSFRFISHTHICKTHCSSHHNSTFKNRLSNNHPWQTIPGDVLEEHHSSPHPEGVKDQTTLHEKSSITRHVCVTTKLWAF